MNLFWSLYTLAFAVACLIVAYAVGYRSMRKEVKCSVRTRGTVVGYSMVQYNGFSLPVVRYMADGREYQVIGPHFKGGVIKKTYAPWRPVRGEQKSNIRQGEPLPDYIVASRKLNSFANIYTSPLMERYPIGSQVDVYYDPSKPKRAYVERYAGQNLFFALWLPLFLGILLIVLSLYFGFVMEF